MNWLLRINNPEIQKLYREYQRTYVAENINFIFLSSLPKDHPPRLEAEQPFARRHRRGEDRGLGRERRVQRQGRFPHKHGRNARVYPAGKSGAQAGGRPLFRKGDNEDDLHI